MFNFIHQDSPHQNLVGTILATGAIQCLDGADSTLTANLLAVRFIRDTYCQLTAPGRTTRRHIPPLPTHQLTQLATSALIFLAREDRWLAFPHRHGHFR
jgi:hypothetical protein